MRRITMEEIQPLMLDVFKAFQVFANEHEIQYYAAGGTLLGAIRHRGFIPWDDDMDLFITEETYHNIVRCAELNPYLDAGKRYKILLPAKAPNVYPMIKLVDTHTVAYEQNVDRKFGCGIYIDVFVMQNWPDDERASVQIIKKQKLIMSLLQLSICGNFTKTKYKIIYPFVWIFKRLMLAAGMNSDFWSKQLLKLGVTKQTNYIGNIAWTSGMIDRYPRCYYMDTLTHAFEDTTIAIPAEYDKILTHFYGDYMEIPPEDKRHRHDFEAYYVD